MKDKTNYEQFDVDKEDEKIKPKKVSKTKYYVIILFLILLNVAVIIMLIKSKITNTTEEIGKDDLKFLLVSDIHDNVTGLDLLLNKVKSKKYSYIFYMGDMVKMTPGQQNSSEHAHIYPSFPADTTHTRPGPDRASKVRHKNEEPSLGPPLLEILRLMTQGLPALSA